MATVTHIIRSDYNPLKDKERLELLTGQRPPPDAQTDAEAEAEADEEWRISSATSAQPRTRLPPTFVPATTRYDPWNTVSSPEAISPEHKGNSKGDGMSHWYRSLSGRTSQPAAGSSAPAVPTPQATAPAPSSTPTGQRPLHSRDWFIQNALSSQSEPTVSAPPPTLDDMLARHPPPLPSEPQFKPQVFLAIGPSNKGFSMLQQQGWNEGEPLGPHVRRGRKPVVTHIIPDGDIVPLTKCKAETPHRLVKLETLNHDLRDVEVIDLTISDDEDVPDKGQEWDDEVVAQSKESEFDSDEELTDGDSSGRTALITPIATVLKADRLGIGLKAKTEGPYRASKKRITHSVAALAAHRRAADRLRLQQQEHGRGRRGFARAKKKEHALRQQMLAYMNS